MRKRCVACGAREAAALRAGWLRCGWCGFGVARALWGRPLDLRRWFQPGRMALPDATDCRFLADAYTARSLATAFGLELRDASNAAARGHSDRQADGMLVPLRARGASQVTLAVMTRPDDARTVPMVQGLAARFADVVVLCDQAPGSPVPDGLEGFATSRPLDGDFGAQRNAMQALARTEWVLHLDSDERPTAAMLASLDALTRIADRDGLDAVGFARVNRVRNGESGRVRDGDRVSDGAHVFEADLFPDVQYRLVRRSQTFAPQVHERPVACSDWRRTMVSRAGAIVHHLDGAHVRARTTTYDALGQPDGHRDEQRALLTPYRGRWPVGLEAAAARRS